MIEESRTKPEQKWGEQSLTPAASALVLRLHETYYMQESTPQHVVSSHWRKMHALANVSVGPEGLRELTGVGFGDMNPSAKASVLNAAQIALYRASGRLASREAVEAVRRVVRRMGLPFSYDVFRQACTLSLLADRLGERVVCIGDGYGVLGAAIREFAPHVQVTFVDLGKTLLFQAYYSSKAHPNCQHVHVLDAGGDDDFVYCPAELLSTLRGRFSLATNIHSMQEMSPTVVAEYFAFLRRTTALFYCCNRLEKRLPGGEVSRFFDYPWLPADQHLIDEECPWVSFYLRLRPPFFCRYPPTHHRLTALAQQV